MNAQLNEIDSQVLGANVVEIVDFSREDEFSAFEAEYIRQFQPRYALCKLPVEDLTGIHSMEKNGFCFVEFQVRSELRLRDRYDTAGLPYVYKPVETDEDLKTVLETAATTFTDDRFSIDPDLPNELGGARYRYYVQKSFDADDELLHKLANGDTGEILGFNTCKQLSDTEMLLFVAGVTPRLKATGLGTILNYYVFNDFLDRGIRRIRTHQSGRNYPILNVEVGHFGFRVVQTLVVLRKLY